jgi:integrase
VIYTSQRVGWMIDGGASDFQENVRVHASPSQACRGEVLGLRWSDIDLRAGTLTINQARVLVEHRVRIEEPKSRNGKRTLPLDDDLVAALTALRKRQLEESTTAGAAYRSRLAELDWYQGGEYVITTKLALLFTPSGTPTSSAACSDGPGCGGSPCTTHVTRP